MSIQEQLSSGGRRAGGTKSSAGAAKLHTPPCYQTQDTPLCLLLTIECIQKRSRCNVAVRSLAAALKQSDKTRPLHPPSVGLVKWVWRPSFPFLSPTPCLLLLYCKIKLRATLVYYSKLGHLTGSIRRRRCADSGQQRVITTFHSQAHMLSN